MSYLEISFDTFKRLMPILKVLYALLSGSFTDDESQIDNYKKQLINNISLISTTDVERSKIETTLNDIMNLPIDKAKEAVIELCNQYGYGVDDLTNSKTMRGK